MRIAIVNNTAVSIEIIRRVVAARPGIEIMWTASNGAEAVEKAAHSRPDLILMGLALPHMDGVQATRAIMKKHPCAILIVTAAVSENSAKVFDAMGNGALDAVGIPVLDAKGNVSGGEDLLKKIETIARLIGKENRHTKSIITKENIFNPSFPMIAIGSSTGGPRALAEILTRMPVKLGAAIVIVQHVDVQFANGLAEWLDGQTGLKVALAGEGAHPDVNTVFVAGTNDHLVLGPDFAFHYTSEPKDYPYRPSADTFFLSVKSHWTQKGVAVLLTGMGRDGARGLLALRKAGWHTIAQDEKSSVVYGMPRAAAELGAAAEVLPIGSIADAVIKQIKDREVHI